MIRYSWTIYPTDPPTVGWYSYPSNGFTPIGGAPQMPLPEFWAIIAQHPCAEAFLRDLRAYGITRDKLRPAFD